MPFKMYKIIYFSRKKNYQKICVPTLPKIFRPFTRSTLIYLFGLREYKFKDIFQEYHQSVKQFGSRSEPTFVRPIRVQTVRKGRLYATKVTTREKSLLSISVL